MKRKLFFIASALLSFLIGGCMAGYNVSEPSLVSDGLRVKNLLYRPSGMEPGRKYPAVVINHGGSGGGDRPVPRVESVDVERISAVGRRRAVRRIAREQAKMIRARVGAQHCCALLASRRTGIPQNSLGTHAAVPESCFAISHDKRALPGPDA